MTANPTPWWNGYRAAFLNKRGAFSGCHLTTVKTVYCISEGWGEPVKVGITSNMKSRVEGLRSATYRDILICWTAQGTALHENAIKRLLRGQNIRCEWFRDDDDFVKLGPADHSKVGLSHFVEALAERSGMPVFIPAPEKRCKPAPVLWLPRPEAAA